MCVCVWVYWFWFFVLVVVGSVGERKKKIQRLLVVAKNKTVKGNNVMEYAVGIQFNADLKEFSSHWAAEIISYSAF